MCGIVGVFSNHGNLAYNDFKVFKELLSVDVVRGQDSTGAFSGNTRKIFTIKADTTPHNLFATKEWDEFDNNTAKCNFVVGHNRAATQGSVVAKNAHPFVEDNIVLIHNGTLHSHKHLANVEVDSHAIAHTLNEHGSKAATLEKLSGAFALVWFDKRTQKVYVARNNERPLWYGEGTGIKIIASEADAITWIGNRNRMAVKEIKPFQDHKLYEWSVNKSSFEIVEDIEEKKHYGMGGVVYPITTTHYPEQKKESNVVKSGNREEIFFFPTGEVKRSGADIVAYGTAIYPSEYFGIDTIVRLTSPKWNVEDVAQLFGDPNEIIKAEVILKTQSTCGPGLVLDFDSIDFNINSQTLTYDRTIPEPMMSSILLHEECSQCSSGLDLSPPQATRVLLNKKRGFQCICKDCIEKRLPDYLQGYFNELSNSSVPHDEPISKKLTKRATEHHKAKNSPREESTEASPVLH